MRDQNKYEPLRTVASASSCRLIAPRAVYNGTVAEEEEEDEDEERKGWVSLDLRLCEPFGPKLANGTRLPQII